MSLGTTFKKRSETNTLRVDFDSVFFPGKGFEARIVDHIVRIENIIGRETTGHMLADSRVSETNPLRVEMSIKDGSVSASPYIVSVSVVIDHGNGDRETYQDSFGLIIVPDSDNVRDIMGRMDRESLNRTRGLTRGDPPSHPNCRSADLSEGRPLSEVLDPDDEDCDILKTLNDIEEDFESEIPEETARKRSIRVIRIDKNRRTRT